LYAAASPGAVLKAIHTQRNANNCVPRLDLVLEENRLQPYIHDGIVTIIYQKKETCFHIFVKNHKQLRSNRIVKGWKNGASWKGDILVMRKGLVHEFVGFHGGDAALADFTVKRLVPYNSIHSQGTDQISIALLKK
ncbi:hypothetical protein L208DRAFT_1339743, partial [Tricholoma matsutake]